MNQNLKKRVTFNLRTDEQARQTTRDDIFNKNFECIKYIVIGYLRRNNFSGLHINLFVPYLCMLLQTKQCVKPVILGQKIICYKNGCFEWFVPQMSSNYKSKFTHIPLFLPYSIHNLFKYSNEKRIVFKFNWILKNDIFRTDTTNHIGIVVMPKTDPLTKHNLLLNVAIPYTYTFAPEFRIKCQQQNIQAYFVSIVTGSLKTRFDRMSLFLNCGRTQARWNIIKFAFTVINKAYISLYRHSKFKQVEVDINKQDCFVFITSSFRVREHSYNLKMCCFAYP